MYKEKSFLLVLTILCLFSPTFAQDKTSNTNNNPQEKTDDLAFLPPNIPRNNPNVSYEGITNRWDQIIEKQQEVEIYLPNEKRNLDSLAIITGAVQVRYNTSLYFGGISFTDKPTTSRIFPGGKAFDPVPNPGKDSNGNPLPPLGLRFPTAYQSNAVRQASFLDVRTEGLLWKRLTTSLTLRQERSLKDVTDASPFLGYAQTYGTRTGVPGDIEEAGRVQLMNAFAQINDIGNKTVNFSIKAGRQYSLFSEGLSAASAFDGVSLSAKVPNWRGSFYVGRRWSFYGDPVDKFLTGASVKGKLPKDINVEYTLSYYRDYRHLLRIGKQIKSFDISSYLIMRDDTPTDVGGEITKVSVQGKGYIKVAYHRKLTDKDYIFDQFVSSSYTGFLKDKVAPFETQLRLNLRPPRRANDISVHGEYFLKPWLGVGGEAFKHNLNNDMREVFDPKNNISFALGRSTPFDAPSKGITLNVQVIPQRFSKLINPRLSVEFHERNFDRGNFQPVTFMADPQGIGETRYREVVSQVLLPFNRWTASFSSYFRSYKFRNRTQNTVFSFLFGSSAFAINTNVAYRINQYSSTSVQYSFDTDFEDFNPDINKAHQVRVSYQVEF